MATGLSLSNEEKLSEAVINYLAMAMHNKAHKAHKEKDKTIEYTTFQILNFLL